MARVLNFILLTTLVPFSIIAQQTNEKGSVPVGASLMAMDNGIPWLSPSGDFAFGFQRQKDSFLLSIWYDKISEKTVVWYPKDGPMVMERSKELNSKISETNFSRGRFQLVLLPDGNLLLIKRDIPSGILYNVYYRSGTRDDFNSTNTGIQLIFDETGYILDGNLTNCECPQGFSLLDPNDPNGDCKPDFTPNCEEGYDKNQFGLIELTNLDWPGFDYVRVQPTNEETCKTFCLQDCFCAVAIYRDETCWKKKLPLSNGKKDPSLVVKAFLKYRKEDLHDQPPYVSSTEKKTQRSLIVVILSTCVFVIFILSGVICAGFFLIHKKTTINHYLSSKLVDTNLPRFTYQELVEATGGFKDELGKGAFGTVYKGVIGVKTVAVKKLDRVFEDGEKEFKTEVNAIAKTHHKNLVQLLGYCDDGDQRLLVYEYMSNGTLASYLFGDMRPSWKLRSDVIVGIAKGLAYLHEECKCSTQVIHCDINPQNILLDDCYNAKISDFGLAKLLMMNQSRMSTGIRGTKGYVAPEWFRNTLVTAKVDVYSFGVLLLEMISCRKSVVINESDSKDVVEVLTDWAWDCYQEVFDY
ncbi:hypothetical protein M8C21_030795 [Ambrosia artemisiifolia]|uniref:non-specific serine/threonine protein kinase n=1 Tax=Ambrosia artemisiifolia TaxID=4212 RepID=A0AAD5CB19_AMBAR|nr:hypothetical protein M8C21_030795 [Ambrosia artemisiifolia]